MNLDYLKEIRLRELDEIIPLISEYFSDQKINILEIGAGSGWQSKELSTLGHDVKAIELASSYYLEDSVWPITTYDGKTIPFEDKKFELIFSSNVIEHIPDIENYQQEIQRVLKPNGIAIHLAPSGTWRFWTTLNHYPNAVSKVVQKLGSFVSTNKKKTEANENEKPLVSIEKKSKLKLLRNLLFPRVHGEYGNFITETYVFSRFRWRRLFQKSGWTIEKILSNRLYYSGYMVGQRFLSMNSRKKLSYLLGGSCNIFVLRKND